MNLDNRSSLFRTYIAPFLNLRRALSFAGIFFGIFGYGLIGSISIYDLSSIGYEPIFVFFATSFVIAGLFYLPAALHRLQRV